MYVENVVPGDDVVRSYCIIQKISKSDMFILFLIGLVIS